MAHPLQEEVEKMAAEAKQIYAEQGTAGTGLCIEGEPVFYLETDQALAPGHIYSQKGVDEYHISKACEFHFDEWFKEED